jgi:hypothetical protein
VALGTETIGFFEPAAHGLISIGHPARAVALRAGMFASKVPATAQEGYRRSGGKRRTFPSPRRIVHVADEHPASRAVLAVLSMFIAVVVTPLPPW